MLGAHFAHVILTDPVTLEDPSYVNSVILKGLIRLLPTFGEDVLETTVQFSFLILGIWVMILLLGYILEFGATVLGRPLAALLNKLVWSSIRQRAWGDDLQREDVSEIGSHPPEFPEQFGPLPEEVADPLSSHSEKHAIEALRKVRIILGMERKSRRSADLRSDILQITIDSVYPRIRQRIRHPL